MTPRRVPLACLPTPLVPAPRLAEILGSGPLWIKRDDLTGFAVAGNKARALEYLLGDALDNGCDVLVAAGSVSSNFCAAAAVAARRCGLDCELLLSESASAGRLDQRRDRTGGRSATALRRCSDSRDPRRRPLGPRGRAPSGRAAALSTAARWGDTHRCGRLRVCSPGDRRAKRRARHPARHRCCRDRVRRHSGWTGRWPGGIRTSVARHRRIGEPADRRSDGTGAGIGEGAALRNSASGIRTPTTWTFVICAAPASA